MKNISILFLVTLVVLFSSCEKVIDLDLDNTEPRLVISGGISDVDSIPIINITQTVNYDQANTFPEIQNATVIVTDNFGTIDTFALHPQGGYRGTTKGVPGRTYSLKILHNQAEYNSTGTMPQPVSIDSVTVSSFSTPRGNLPVLNTYFKDPQGEKNYYYLKYLINGVDNNDPRFLSDELQDGRTITVGSIDESYEKAMTGDTITVQLQSIDASMYEYLLTLEALRDAGGGGLGSTTPDNPTSNITNNALGYFKVYSQKEMNFIIP